MVEGSPVEEGREIIEVSDADTLKEALAEETARAESYMASWQRNQADFINYKRRAQQEKEEIGSIARSEAILALLPALDDLERALDSIPSRLERHPWTGGIKLIASKFRLALKAQGVAEINAIGQDFNPDLHEAAMHVPGKEGVVIKELYKGYKIGDKIIRPSRVVVGNGKEE